MLNQFKYGFIEYSSTCVRELAELLSLYNESARGLGKYTSLLVFFNGVNVERGEDNIDNYYTFFWDLLSKTNDLDKKEWPAHIPKDPHKKLWQFCFDGEELFVYCATPSHIRRNSRSFPYFMLAITPRWVFNEFRKHPVRAERIKAKIHERLEIYDDIEIHPDLRLYGEEDNFEWKQYFLRDDNQTPAGCPFSSKIAYKNEVKET